MSSGMTGTTFTSTSRRSSFLNPGGNGAGAGGRRSANGRRPSFTPSSFEPLMPQSAEAGSIFIDRKGGKTYRTRNMSVPDIAAQLGGLGFGGAAGAAGSSLGTNLNANLTGAPDPQSVQAINALLDGTRRTSTSTGPISHELASLSKSTSGMRSLHTDFHESQYDYVEGVTEDGDPVRFYDFTRGGAVRRGSVVSDAGARDDFERYADDDYDNEFG